MPKRRDRRKPGTPKNVGRPRGPSKRRTKEVEESLLAHVRAGGVVEAWCQEHGWDPKTVWRWACEDDTAEAFGPALARAREVGAWPLAESVLPIADDAKNDTIVVEDGDPRPNNEWIGRSRIRIEARKWLAEKWSPKQLGQRTAITGHEDAPPLIPPKPVPQAVEAVAAITRLFELAARRKAEAAAADAQEERREK